jgi:hypothetical protein
VGDQPVPDVPQAIREHNVHYAKLLIDRNGVHAFSLLGLSLKRA